MSLQSQNIFLKNENAIFNWLKDSHILAVDRGFRDAVPTMKTFGLYAEMPDFRTGKKQLTTEQANHSRSITKVRWVLESGGYHSWYLISKCQLLLISKI